MCFPGGPGGAGPAWEVMLDLSKQKCQHPSCTRFPVVFRVVQGAVAGGPGCCGCWSSFPTSSWLSTDARLGLGCSAAAFTCNHHPPCPPVLGLAPAFTQTAVNCSPWRVGSAGRSGEAASGRSGTLLHPLKCHVGGTAAGDGVRVMRWTFVARVHLSAGTRHHVALASRWKLLLSLM